ncbi:MAG: hypothetical protein BGO55_12065 [Sphingobacteriales bacterium 50-39]|nr:hypothetical protein [Sphingobacteriales bacterium]OJW54418.1 MAG: hypothetical protein BGO55_12065 [Sphingobacteriales bacterium 50-39]
MTIQIEIQNTHVNDLISFYSNKLRGIKDQIATLEMELRDINSIISQLKQGPVDTFTNEEFLEPSSEKYSASWPWVKKIAFAVREAGRPITTKEIVNILEKFEPNFAIQRKRAISSVSSTLSVKSGKYSDKKEFIKVPTDSGEFAYEPWKEIKMGKIQPIDSTHIKDLPF